MSQSANPDPTGVFSKTEYDLAAGKGLNAPQPEPIFNDWPAVWELVISDMQGRDALGTAKYGTRLQPHNGRDALVDAYQEALDMCVYLRQLIFERNGS